MKIYLVGGCVRDKLLGLPIKDRDWVVVGASAAELIDKGYQQVGKDFPVFYIPTVRKSMPWRGLNEKPHRVMPVLNLPLPQTSAWKMISNAVT